MSLTPISALCAVTLCLGAAVSPAQTPLPSNAPSIKAGAEEVLLDVIVRDKKGRPMKDLQAADFDVSDNGVKQKLLSVRLVEGVEAISKSGGAPTKLDPLRQIRLVSLVFDKLDLEARRVSRTAALDILKQDLGQNVYYSVWVIDQRLSAVQQFTNDRELLRKAIEHATSGAYTEYASQSAAIKKNLENQIGQPANASGQSLSDQVNNIASQGYDPSQRMMAQIMYRILSFDEQAITMQAGRSSIFALLGLAREQAPLPGRKTIVYLNEGLVIPISMDEAFRSLLSTANRSNVSFYPIDARGLLVGAQNTNSVNGLSDALASSARTTQRDGGAVDVSEVKSEDTAQASMRANAQNALATMAESTGGKLVANTNDFRAPLRQLAEDINTYYEITYNPAIQNYDGQYRKIAVKVDRSDARLQTRDGYFALPTLEGGNP
ncbi:MAG TPA: VWA domain-containing protein, partial [Casimicrobiaceae bacterium]